MAFRTPLFAKTTAAVASTILDLGDARPGKKYHIRVDGNMAANTITFNWVGVDDVTMTVANYPGTVTPITLSATATSFCIDFPCKMQMVKGITTNAITVVVNG